MPVVEPTPCEPNPCENGGTCSAMSGVPICICLPDFEGENCDRPKRKLALDVLCRVRVRIAYTCIGL